MKKQKRKRKQFFDNETKDLEKFNHVNVKCHLMMPTNVNVGQHLEARIDIINASKVNAVLSKIENLPNNQFEIETKNHEFKLSNGVVDLKNTALNPFDIQVVKLVLKPLKTFAGDIPLRLAYVDDLGEKHVCESNSIHVNVSPIINTRIGQQETSIPILPGRITTGILDIDGLLYGGIPEGYSIILSSSPNDERKKITETFLQAGISSNEPIFFLTENPSNSNLIMTERPNLFIFLCSQKSAPLDSHNANVFNIKGLENLTDIDIAIFKASRSLPPSYTGSKRALIDVTSDVLLQHGALIARKWLGSLLLDLKKKGFTVLATVDPQMHSKTDLQAVLSLFEGQLEVLERQSEKGTEKWLRVVRLQNQKYFSQEIQLKQIGRFTKVNVEETVEHIRISDGFELFARRWASPTKADETVVCIHGLGGCSGCFKRVGLSLASKGMDVWGVDLRGFGYSKEPWKVEPAFGLMKRIVWLQLQFLFLHLLWLWLAYCSAASCKECCRKAISALTPRKS